MASDLRSCVDRKTDKKPLIAACPHVKFSWCSPAPRMRLADPGQLDPMCQLEPQWPAPRGGSHVVVRGFGVAHELVDEPPHGAIGVVPPPVRGTISLEGTTA